MFAYEMSLLHNKDNVFLLRLINDYDYLLQINSFIIFYMG